MCSIGLNRHFDYQNNIADKLPMDNINKIKRLQNELLCFDVTKI